ncbi:hypothetical protein H4R34_005304 [Dimargaris verticillata]|uniref:Uncharacterized protein n=1 Tax=Dimargaris verticillata TaxID=2761393 RepID=A0A9W8B363_9FUNG|nr:hypothetical protein H4R34_005304 [Dimargaris verticillata]
MEIPASRQDLEGWYVDLSHAEKYDPNVWTKTFQQYGLTRDTVRLFFRHLVSQIEADSFEFILFNALQQNNQRTVLLSSLVGYSSNAKMTKGGVEMFKLKDVPLKDAYDPQFIWTHLLEYAVIQGQPQLSLKVFMLLTSNAVKRFPVPFVTRAMLLDIYKTLFRYFVAYDCPDEVEALFPIANRLQTPLEMFYTTMYAWSVALDNELILEELEGEIDYGLLCDLEAQMRILGMYDASIKLTEIIRERHYSPILDPIQRNPARLLFPDGFQFQQVRYKYDAEILKSGHGKTSSLLVTRVPV